MLEKRTCDICHPWWDGTIHRPDNHDLQIDCQTGTTWLFPNNFVSHEFWPSCTPVVFYFGLKVCLGDSFLFVGMQVHFLSWIKAWSLQDGWVQWLFIACEHRIPLASGAGNCYLSEGSCGSESEVHFPVELRAPHLASSLWPLHMQLLPLRRTSSLLPFPGKFFLIFPSQLPCHFLPEAFPPSNNIGLLLRISASSHPPQNTADWITVVCPHGLSFLLLGEIYENDGRRLSAASLTLHSPASCLEYNPYLQIPMESRADHVFPRYVKK